MTKAFCKRTGVKSVIRSHQLPKRQRGFEITHNSMLLTIFSASNYGGVCRNRGGVLIFDDKGAPRSPDLRGALPLPLPLRCRYVAVTFAVTFAVTGPAEVKEFYAPPLDEYRQMCDTIGGL